MDTVTAILWVSVTLQLLAAGMALRLIPLSGRATAWSLFSVVFVLMSARRAISLLHDAGLIAKPQHLLSLIEPVALVISILLVIAIHYTRRIFEESNKTQQQLKQQLDELRRFQKLTVGRELDMIKLKEENARLREKLNIPAANHEQSSK